MLSINASIFRYTPHPSFEGHRPVFLSGDGAIFIRPSPQAHVLGHVVYFSVRKMQGFVTIIAIVIRWLPAFR
jgi:hypothetical protein